MPTVGLAMAVLVAAAPVHPAQLEQRRARLERGLAAQRAQIDAVRSKPESFELWTDKPGAHLLFDAVGDCVTTERLGRSGDGGKWVCNPYQLAAGCVVYGFGAGTEISFEEAMASLGCEVHVFDPTPSAVARFAALSKGKKVGTGSVTFHPWGLGPVSRDPAKALSLTLEGKPCEVKTLASVAKELGHTRVDLLKVDIEGGEWAVMDDVLSHGLLERLGVRMLLTELHIWQDARPKDLVDLLDSLARRDFFLYRKELNPWTPGCCSEYAFAQRGFLLE